MNNENEGEKPRDIQAELPWPEGSTEKAYEETNASMDQLSEKLQEPDPEGLGNTTSLVETPSFEATMRKYYADRDARVARSKESLKETCKILFKAGIPRVEISYDGYGDSGCIDRVEFFKETWAGKRLLKDKEIDSLKLPTSTTEEQYYHSEKKEYLHKDVECTMAAKIEACAYDFLPGGYEINEGSFGDLVINTEKAKVTLKHNTRIESSEYSEDRFDLNSSAADVGTYTPPDKV